MQCRFQVFTAEYFGIFGKIILVIKGEGYSKVETAVNRRLHFGFMQTCFL